MALAPPIRPAAVAPVSGPSACEPLEAAPPRAPEATVDEDVRRSEMRLRATVFGRSNRGVVRPTNLDGLDVFDLSLDPIGVALETPVTIDLAHGALLAVSDGVPGSTARQVAVALALSALGPRPSGGSLPSSLEVLRSSLGRRMQLESPPSPAAGPVGASAMALLLHRAGASVACVGTVGVYLVRDRRLSPLAPERTSPDGLPASKTSLEASGWRHVLCPALGLPATTQIRSCAAAVRIGDRILACSDGLTETMSDDEILTLVFASRTVQEACDALTMLAIERGAPDNVTVLVAELVARRAPDREAQA